MVLPELPNFSSPHFMLEKFSCYCFINIVDNVTCHHLTNNDLEICFIGIASCELLKRHLLWGNFAMTKNEVVWKARVTRTLSRRNVRAKTINKVISSSLCNPIHRPKSVENTRKSDTGVRFPKMPLAQQPGPRARSPEGSIGDSRTIPKNCEKPMSLSPTTILSSNKKPCRILNP